MSESSASLLAAARVGTSLRRKYRLDALLGVGGAGAVYAATHRNGGRVAIKILDPRLAGMGEIRGRFLREGYAANKVGHPGAVRVLDDDDDEDNGTVFLVLELLEGTTVAARQEAAGGRLPLDLVASLTTQLLDVLGSAHANGIVHRDIKPENLFLTRQDELKVLDFGIARVLDATNATKTGQVMGTPAYMAPEQAGGRVREIDGRTDLWSVGATVFALLSGRHVHEGATSVMQMVLAATQHARPLASVAPAVPPAIQRVVDRALAFDKAARWPSAAAMRDALTAARRDEPPR